VLSLFAKQWHPIFKIKFPASFHQISPPVYKISTKHLQQFVSCDSNTCFLKVVQSPRLVVSFFPDFVSFNSSIECFCQQTASIHYWLVYPKRTLFHAISHHALHSISSHLSFNWFFNFRLHILSCEWINNCKNSYPLFNWQFLLSWFASCPNNIFKHSDLPLIQLTSYHPVHHPSLTICDDFPLNKIINQ
jgi:hypothetical protein